MVVQRINGDRYLINNPIWVDITSVPDAALFVTISIEPVNGASQVSPPSLRLYAYNNAIQFDLSDAIKSFFPVPDFSRETANDVPIQTNYLTTCIVFRAIGPDGSEVLEEVIVNKTFIRGGRDTQRFNASVALSAVLKESTKIPRWGGFPVRKYYFEASRDTRKTYYNILSTTIIPADETEQRRVIGCNPIYFKFLNTLGGYSYWLFETFTAEKSAGKAQIVENRNANYSLGNEIEYELEVEGRVEREYYQTMRALIQSPEIYVWDLNSKVFADRTGTVDVIQARDPWVKVFAGKNKISFESNEDLKDVSLKFEIKTEQRPTVKW